jgi:hypothetical protein
VKSLSLGLVDDRTDEVSAELAIGDKTILREADEKARIILGRIVK